MRPIEWLLQVTQERYGYVRLLSKSAGLPAAAAYGCETDAQSPTQTYLSSVHSSMP